MLLKTIYKTSYKVTCGLMPDHKNKLESNKIKLEFIQKIQQRFASLMNTTPFQKKKSETEMCLPKMI